MDNETSQPSTPAAPVEGGTPSGGATQDTGNTQAQPAPQATPTGDVTHNATQTDPYAAENARLNDHVKGLRGFYEPLKAAGINDPSRVPEVVGAYQTVQALRERGIDVNALIDGSNKPEAESQQAAQPLTEAGLAAMLDKREATSSHESGMSQANTRLLGIIGEFGSDEATKSLYTPLMQQVVTEFYRANGSQYPIGHPLEGQYVPITESQVGQVKQAFVAKVDEARGIFAREQVAAGHSNVATPGQAGSDQTPASTNPQRVNLRQEMKNRATEDYYKNLADVQAGR